ncbi:MAG: SdpI family protein [Synergistetes bacterium]|nr:SdpI family protein [Synergistota bacterium]
MLFSFVIGVYFYPKLPDVMACHWNSQGEVNGYTSKFWGTFMIPFILLGLFVLFCKLAGSVPERFGKWFVPVFFVFMVGVQICVILWNLGFEVKIASVVMIGIGALLFFTGVICKGLRRNRLFGVRTPWALRSERVWDKTQRVGGTAFKITGAVVCIGAFFPKYALFFILMPIALATVYVMIYSYIEYKREVG